MDFNYGQNSSGSSSDSSSTDPNDQAKKDLDAAKLAYEKALLEQQKASSSIGNTAGFMKTFYGLEDLSQLGKQSAQLRNLAMQRALQSGSDAEAAGIRSQIASTGAGTARNLASMGVKGGAAAGAIGEATGRAAQRAAEQLSAKRAGDIQLAGQLTRQPAAVAQAKTTPVPKQESGGKVICTELNKQGILSDSIYKKDAEYGEELFKVDPYVLIGYHFWALPIVNLMKKSKIFTRIVSYPALKWAKHIAGEEKSLFGYFCVHVGQPVCRIIGKGVSFFLGESHAF